MKSFRRLFVPLLLALTLTSCRGLPSKAPDFTLSGIDPAQKVTLSEAYKDSPVLLAFWASWCPSCNEEIPELKRIYQEYASKGLKIYAVNVQEPREEVQKFAASEGLPYPILLDEKGEVADRYKLDGLPVCVVLAKGGEILYYGFSLPENLEQLLARNHK